MTNPTAPAETAPPPLFLLSALLDDLATDAAARHQARQNGRPLGPITRLNRLDQILGNTLAPGLHILHGSPGSGKTAFALQTAADCGAPALYVTTEMSALELLRRHTARISGTYLGKFKSGELAPEFVLQEARKAATVAPLLAILDATETPAPLESIQRPAEALRKKSDLGHLLVIVDSLHTWADGLADGMEEYDRLNFALSALRLLSKRLACPVLAIAERNRASMKGGQSAGAGTRKIEYGAESVIELNAKEEANADGETEVELRVSKNRSGATGKVPLLFHGALQRFKEDVF